jgi:hypothetical protein
MTVLATEACKPNSVPDFEFGRTSVVFSVTMQCLNVSRVLDFKQSKFVSVWATVTVCGAPTCFKCYSLLQN